MNRTIIAAAVAAAFLLSGCAVKPVAIDDADHHRRAEEDRHRLYAGQEALTRPLTLADAAARAFKYNMEYRTRLMEEAAAMGQTELANFDMLPKLTAQAGYFWRNNDSFGFGYTPAGTISTTPSAAVERAHNTNGITFAWNVLDFGLSYVRAKQLADQSLIAEERRRKAQQNLLQDVRIAWWRAEAAQRLLPEIDALLAEVDQAAARAKLIETRKLLPPLQIVAYRRSLLDLEQQISLRRQDLEQAMLDLAQLINLPPGQEYTLASPAGETVTPPDLSAHLETLENLALDNRPELREEGYRARITDLEGKKQLLALLPSVGFEFGTNYDSNKYLVNKRWTSAGLTASINLMKAFSVPTLLDNNKAAARMDETRRLALTAAVLAQTRMAAVRYGLLNQELAIWDDAVQDDSRIVGYLNAAKQVGLETELEFIRAKARGMISRINRDLVHANVQGAIGRIYNSIGIDPLPLEVESHSGQALAQALDERVKNWEARNFTPKPALVPKPVAVVPVKGLPREGGNAFTTAIQRILRLSKVAVAPADQAAPYRLETAVSLRPPETSGQQAHISVRLVDEAGTVISQAEQTSMLVLPIGPDQWAALGEGAAYRMVAPLRSLYAATPARSQAPAKPLESAQASGAPSTGDAMSPIPNAADLLKKADQIKPELSATIQAARERGAKQ